MKLAENLDILIDDTAFWAAGVFNPDYPIDQLGHLSEDVSERIRGIAIGFLLTEGDSDRFTHSLIRSALVRIQFLERARKEKFESFHSAVSRTGSFFDALAAGSFDHARKITDLSPKQWISSGEYEDDFCFTSFFHLMIQKNKSDSSLLNLLERFEDVLEEEDDPRLNLCRALAEQDQDEFDSSFDSLLDQRESQIADVKDRDETPVTAAGYRIYIEGLGILKVAEQLGLKTEPEYQFCPALARVPLKVPFPGK